MFSKGNILLGLVVATGLLLMVAILAGPLAITAAAQESNGKSSDRSTQMSESSSQTHDHYKVDAGGGGATGPITAFMPRVVHIHVGNNVTWVNPTTVGEPHTVTFINDNKTDTDVFSPFAVKNSTLFSAIPPNANARPMLMPGPNGTEVVVGANQRALIGTLIAANGTVIPLGPNANYTMKGDEKFVNSGTIMPKGMENQLPGSGNTFTVTFEKAGTYNYTCLFHDWMNGTIVVDNK